jgi:hypothetical protein
MAVVIADPKVLATTFNDTFNAHDESAIKALVSPNIRFTAPGGVRLIGQDAIAGYFAGWLKGFPDARMTVHHEIVSGRALLAKSRRPIRKSPARASSSSGSRMTWWLTVASTSTWSRP